jgi:hypothetical protein
MTSLVINDKAVTVELVTMINGDAHVNALEDFMTPYGLFVPMNNSCNILRMVLDSESIEQLMDLEFNKRYRCGTGFGIYLYLDWNSRAWLVFVYETKVHYQRLRQTATPYYFTNNCEPMVITAVNETFTEETTLAQAGVQVGEMIGEIFGQTVTIVFSEWIKQKPEGAVNLPTFPSFIPKDK